jgi:uncharacterized membrane protein
LSAKRLYFIDAVRAFAILMMLQGHFIDTLMAPEFHESNSTAYGVWRYFRGITAPTFFTISGLIFTYLLLRSKSTGTSKKRIKKGIYRGLLLIAIGYSLRIPIFDWLTGTFPIRFLKVDVLQIIGLSLISIIALYHVTFKKSLLLSCGLLLIGLIIFTTEPWYRHWDTGDVPILLANYVSKQHGSVFTFFPWFGYMAIGGFMASIFYRYLDKEKFKPVLILSMLITGMVLIYHSSTIFENMVTRSLFGNINASRNSA